MNTTIFRNLSVVALGFILLTACAPRAQPGTIVSDASCETVSLAVAAAFPGEEVRISGLPQDLDGFYVEVQAAGEQSSTVLREYEDGQVALVTPVHPAGIEGGDAQLTVTDGTTRCSEVALTVKPLSSADGAFDSYVRDLGDYLAVWRDQADVTRQQLLEDQVPPELVPLAIAQYIYDSPSNSNALMYYANGTIPLNEADKALLDATIARLETQQVLEEVILQHRAVASAVLSPTGRRSLQGSTYTAAELSEAMTEQDECLQTLSGATGQLLTDADLASLALGFANPALGEATGLAIVATKFPLETCAFLLPSKFTRMDLEVTTTEFNEDYNFQTEGGGSLNAVKVSGESEGWNATGILIDVALAGTAPAGREVARLRGVERQTDFVQEANATVASVTNNVCGRSDCQDEIAINIKPIPFFNVEIAEPDYALLTAIDSIQLVAGSWGEYIPAAVGRGGLRVETQPVFGDAHIGQSEVIDVNAIEVDIDPQAPTLSVGETVTFEAEIRNSNDPGRNHWTLTSPSGESQLVARDAPRYTFTAPDFSLEDPCEGESKVWEINVESMTMTGLRASTGAEPRIGFAGAIVQKPPDSSCVTPSPTPTPQPDACLPGTWSMDMDSYLEYMQAVTPAGTGEVTGASGTFLLTLTEDGQAMTEADYTVTISGNGASFPVDMQETGTTTYSADPDAGTLVVGGGQTATASLFGASASVGTEGGAGTYTCEGDTLAVQLGPYPPVVFYREGGP